MKDVVHAVVPTIWCIEIWIAKLFAQYLAIYNKKISTITND